MAGEGRPLEYQERAGYAWGDFTDMVELFGADARAVISAPARFDRGDWLRAGLAAAAFAWLYQYDGDIHRMTQQNRRSGFLKTIEDVGDEVDYLGLMGKTGRFYAAGMTAGYAFKWEKLERVSTDILFSHFVAGLIRQGFIRVADRSRPNERKGTYNYGDGGTSLPSGHSSTIFQLATVLSFHFPHRWAQAAFYTLATCVAVQRATVEQHWASDSFLGAVYGYAVAKVIVGTNNRRGYLVVPRIDTSSGEAGAALQFNF